MQNPQLAIVIALWPDAVGAAECLASLQAQSDGETQWIAAPALPPPPELVRQFPDVQWLDATPGALIPHLWAKGFAAARGDLVAITIGQLVPARDWVAQIKAAHQRLDAAGIGGAIEPPCGGSAGDWATYFLRYSSLFELDREQRVADLAGDNASYKRAALAAHREAMSEGFWEPEIHRRLCAENQILAFVPTIRVTQRASFGIARFCAQRLSHGRHFGRDRMRGKPWWIRLARAATAPLVPLVLLAKILARLGSRPAYFGAFVKALPALLLFGSCWAAGEFCGCLTPASDLDRPLPPRQRIPV